MADNATPPAAAAAAPAPAPAAVTAPPAPTAAAPASPNTSKADASPAAPAAPSPKADTAAVPKPGKPTHFVHKDELFKSVCRSFMNRKCSRGAACPNVHDTKLCSRFYRTGDCKFGSECRKSHVVTVPEKKEGGAVAATGAAGATPQAASTDGASKKSRKSKDTKKKNESGVGGGDAKPRDPAAASKKGEAANKTGNDAVTGASDKKKPHASERKKKAHKTKKNTECFDPMTEPVDLRVTYDLGTHKDSFSTSLTTRDVLLAPNLFSDFKQGELYAKLVAEIEACGVPPERLLKLWHGNDKIEGTHLIADDKTSWKRKCPTFDLVIDRVTQFFKLSVKATRFNWYKDTSQWKPFHFDAAAVKPEIAAKQNFTVGISFGATRDAAFEHADSKTVVSIPQPDGCVYAFARDTNVLWRHGILQDNPVRNEGRISVIAWGWIDGMVDTEQDAVVTAVTSTS